jgi:hypothetical protein
VEKYHNSVVKRCFHKYEYLWRQKEQDFWNIGTVMKCYRALLSRRHQFSQ